VLNEHNTVFAWSSPLYATGTSWAHQSRRCKRHLDRFSRFCSAHKMTDWPTDQLTDDARRSATIGRVHTGEAKFCYCLQLQQVFIGAVDSNTPCLPFLCKGSPDGATRNWGRRSAPHYSSRPRRDERLRLCTVATDDVAKVFQMCLLNISAVNAKLTWLS